MLRYSLSWYLFAFTLLESILKTHLTVYDSSHAFIADDRRYFEDELSSLHGDLSGFGSSNIDDIPYKFKIKFEPSILDFKRRPLGVPHLKKVVLFNADANRSIDMTSISGSTAHFHSSFFEDKKIPPLGNTSFNVVFLGREEGFVESTLFIHTNEGHFKYDVKGSSVYSPYRLRPIIGLKLPINSSFSPLIYMHNPHSEVIQIIEVYSSSGDFHLELPSGELEGPKNMWEILPLETKAVIRVRYFAKTIQNHTAYIRIRLNNTKEVLVVPLEIEVTNEGGLYHPQGFVDFGVGGSLDPPKQINLCLYNPLKKPVKIHNVSTTSKSIRVHFQNVKLQPSFKNDNPCVNIGMASVDWEEAFKYGETSGKFTVTYRNGKAQSEIPYYLTVLEGGLFYDEQATRYFINCSPDELSVRKIRVKNNFVFPLWITNITLPDLVQDYLTVTNFKPVIVKPKAEHELFSLNLKNGVQLNGLNLDSFAMLWTNVSEVFIPIVSYNGKLNLHLPYKNHETKLNLGLMSMNSKKEIKFIVFNPNPISIKIKSVKSSVPQGSLEILGCDFGNFSLALLQVSLKNLTKCVSVKSNEYAVILLKVRTGNVEGQTNGEVLIETQYENLSIPFLFKTASGKLEIGPDRLVFDQCFPGKICSHPLRVHSTFNDPMIIEDIVSLPPDARLSSKINSHILARTSKVIGYLYLDPSLDCMSECYTGLQYDTTAQWLRTLNLKKTISEFDTNLVNIFYNRYLNVTSNGLRKWQNLTLRLDTTEVRGHIFQSRMKMSWPSLLNDCDFENKSIITFPLTQIGNETYQNITIRNPSSFNIVVQIVLDLDYPEMQDLYEGLPPDFFPPDFYGYKKLYHNFFFHESFKKSWYEFKDKLELNVHEDSIPVLLSPGENFTFTVGFKGDDTSLHSALIFLRNNLTMVEVLTLTGRATNPEFKFGNRKPGSSSPLLFDLTEKHLKDCEKERSSNKPPNLTVRRYFTARNTGDIPIYINNFYINSQPCEGNGFRILNCVPFILLPNATKKIDIAFTPDFTLTKVVRTLILDTSLGYQVNYTLETSVPYHYLDMCSNVLARPEWEMYVWYICINCTIFSLTALLFIAFIDASKITSQAISALSVPSSPCMQHTLDLKLLGQQTRSEIRSVKAECKSNTSSEEKSMERKNEPSSSEITQKIKPEVEIKTPILIPTTGKTKKKLAKKNSNEVSVCEQPEVHKKNCEVQKITKPKVEEKVEEKKSAPPPPPPPVVAKKPLPSKKIVKNIPVPNEEETSSTTTESSNNDDADKENSQNSMKPLKKVSSKTSCNEEPQLPSPSPQTVVPVIQSNFNRNERRRISQKSGINNGNPKIQRNETQEKPEHNHKLNENRKSHKSNRDRKDKQSQNKKTVEKAKSVDGIKPFAGTASRISPTVSSNIWTENSPSFSDVARSDGSTIRSMNQLPQPSKPTVYVEPYKQTPAQLGPIGSRREYWQDNCDSMLGNAGNNGIDHNRLSSNSFFSNAQDKPVETSQSLLDELISSDTWINNTQPNILNILESNSCAVRPDSWNQPGNVNPTNSFWSNTSTVNMNPGASGLNLLGNTPPVPPQRPVTEQTSYLWGSSSVWQPWAPPEAPPRTPPGFDALLQRKREEQAQQREVYDPFATNRIWPQSDTYSWNFSQK